MKGILDPVHGFIPIREEIMKIIDEPLFQRLGHVYQLSMCKTVFIGADHKRKSHCIGAMHLANRYIQYLVSNCENINQKDAQKVKKVLQISALLHDICHGPFSHSWDSTVYDKIYPGKHKGHDKHRIKALQYLKEKLDKIGINIQNIKDVWTGKSESCDKNIDFSGLTALIQGPLGVDRMDFIKRDTYYTGTAHFGVIDSDRVIYNTILVNRKVNGKIQTFISYNQKIIPDIIQGLRTRLDMYQNVYLNKTVVAGTILVEAMVKTAYKHLNYIERTKNFEQFKYLTDDFIIGEIINSKDKSMDESKIYANALYQRNLPKMVNERIIYVKNCKINHKVGIKFISHASKNITELKAIWRSRVLSNDFASDFDKYSIHVYKNGKHIPFSEYYQIQEKKYFYIEREYSYN